MTVHVRQFYCEYPEHEGQRLVVSPYDQYTATIDIVRRDGGRRHTRDAGGGVRGGLHLCERCANVWRERLKLGDYALSFEQERLEL